MFHTFFKFNADAFVKFLYGDYYTRGIAIRSTVLVNDSNGEITNDEQDGRKVAISEALDSLDHAKCFAEIHGDKQMNLMLNELIEKVGTIKLQNVSIYFLRNKVVCYHN